MRVVVGMALSMSVAGVAAADDGPPQPLFSDTQIIERSGWHFEEPGVDGYDARHMLTLNYFDAWTYGRNLFFVDMTLPWQREGNVLEIYNEVYSSLSLSALSGHAVRAGFVKDVLVTAGLNVGAASNGAGALAFLPGASLDFDIPGFTVASLDVLAFIDRSRFDGADAGCRAVGVDLTASWQRPWSLGPLAGTVEGYVEVITGHGACATQTLTQPQLRVDVGRLFDRPGRLLLGFELEVWLAKYGIAGLDEYVPRTLAAWRF